MNIKEYTIVFVHGWGGSKQSLSALSDLLVSKGFKTLVLELVGHGETLEMNKPWNMVDFANWLKEEIIKNNITKYVLLGHSFGGKIILEAVISKLLKPEKSILINISGVKPKNTIKKAFFTLISIFFRFLKNFGFLDKLKYYFYRYVVRETDYVKLGGNLKKTFKNIIDKHYNDKLVEFNSEALIIWGKQDTYTPVWMGKFLSEKILKNVYYELDGTHSLPIKYPEKFINLIVKFLKND